MMRMKMNNMSNEEFADIIISMLDQPKDVIRKYIIDTLNKTPHIVSHHFTYGPYEPASPIDDIKDHKMSLVDVITKENQKRVIDNISEMVKESISDISKTINDSNT